ncbi:MAG TPA: hypothetical protein VN256_07185 [Pyrinomonadaceae bacterium]|nr:hypothetical protein [Pyrinomonadaceae bacterium]
MKIFRVTLKLLTLCLFAAVLSTQANAQATRTWVSGVGDDANPCSRTAPCKTWAGAISKTAINGEIDAMDPGGYGALTITKSITVDGGGTFASILASGTSGVIVNIPAGNANDPHRTARLRRLSINGSGSNGSGGTRTGFDGVRIFRAASVFIDDVVIQDFAEEGVDVNSDTDIALVMDDVQIRNCNGTGVKTQATGAAFVAASLNNLRVQMCNIGVEAGLRTRVNVNGSTITRNPTGLRATSNSSVLNIANTFVTISQTVGVMGASGAIIRLSSCTVTQNGTGIDANGGQMISLDGNSVFGNATVEGVFTSAQGKL